MMSCNILIIDAVSAKPYSVESLYTEPMGGTEATVVRVARALSGKNNITIAQASRESSFRDVYGIGYVPYAYNGKQTECESPDHVIVVRAHKILPKVRKQYPSSRLYLWMHCFPGKHARHLNSNALKTQTTLITVSDFHKQNVTGFLRKYGRYKNPESGYADVIRIYNPIDDNLKPDGTAIDHNKLVYFSSPHKGLEQVLYTFAYLRKLNPVLRLYIANPGYLRMKSVKKDDGVIYLGSLPHHQIIKHVREAFCVFYPQTNFRETFGLVFAEANAVGTPVLAHPIGSTAEVLHGNSQIIDCNSLVSVAKTLIRWQSEGRPLVQANEKFRCLQVAHNWEKVLRQNTSVAGQVMKMS